MEDESTSGLESLREALRAEHSCCASLAEVLRAERAAAAGHDLAGLVAALRDREAVQARWQAAARRRGDLLAGRRTTLADAAARDPEVASLGAALAEQAGRVWREQAVNADVLARSLEAVNEILGAVRRHLPSARYDGGAALTAGAPPSPGAGWRA